jgi:hypothetical protein
MWPRDAGRDSGKRRRPEGVELSREAAVTDLGALMVVRGAPTRIPQIGRF